MFEFILPLILNLLLILYCIFNMKTKYNILYIIWILLSFLPIASYFVLIATPILCITERDKNNKPFMQPKPTKLNKFLFGYEERKN